MKDGIYFADAELPFHVWVRERSGGRDRWVLRELPGRHAREARESLRSRESSTPASDSP